MSDSSPIDDQPGFKALTIDDVSDRALDHNLLGFLAAESRAIHRDVKAHNELVMNKLTQIGDQFSDLSTHAQERFSGIERMVGSLIHEIAALKKTDLSLADNILAVESDIISRVTVLEKKHEELAEEVRASKKRLLLRGG